MPSTKISLYTILRRGYWLLPSILRNQLHGIRHNVVRFLRTRVNNKPQTISSITDMNWLQFNAEVLSPQPDRSNVIIFELNVDWNIKLFQRPQHMAIALGTQGRLVIYKTIGDDLIGFRQVAENVWLANDPAVASMHGVCRCYYSTSLVIKAADILAASKNNYIVYEYIDHIDASISGGKAILKTLNNIKQAALEQGLADMVVASAASLYSEAEQFCGQSHCVYIPNGVDVDHYRTNVNDTDNPPASLNAFRTKYSHIVGYFGAIAPWLWYEMIRSLSQQMPDIGFVFIGPDYSGCVSKLPKHDNVQYMGAVDYSVLPSHAKWFDICFIPFMPGPVAQSTSPLKLFEYFALEKPVVVTSCMSECTAFSEVFSGHDVTTLSDAIKKAIEIRNDDNFKTRLRTLADNNSWTIRAEQYSNALNNIISSQRIKS